MKSLIKNNPDVIRFFLLFNILGILYMAGLHPRPGVYLAQARGPPCRETVS